MSFDYQTENKFRGMFSKKKRQNPTASDIPTSPVASGIGTLAPTELPISGETKHTFSYKFLSTTSEMQKQKLRSSILDLERYPYVTPGRTRQVLGLWPRPPIGPHLRRTNPKDGKHIPGEGVPELWGATMYDFMRVRKIADMPNYMSITTGNRMLSWFNSLDETDKKREWKWAQTQITLAEAEPEPEELKPVNIAELIKTQRERVASGLYKFMPMPRNASEEEEATVSDDPFHISNYPKPYPLVPFSSIVNPLQACLPYHLLPQKLIVHDPWNLLAVIESPGSEYDSSNDGHSDEEKEREKVWTDKPDIVRVYNISLSPDVDKAAKKARADAIARWEKECNAPPRTRRGKVMLPRAPPPPEGESVPCESLFFCPDPLPPRPVTEVKLAHVYISPEHKIGVGHHSKVYCVEWELPREVLGFDPALCKQCAYETYEEAKAAYVAGHPEALEERGTLRTEKVLVEEEKILEVYPDEVVEEKEEDENLMIQEPEKREATRKRLEARADAYGSDPSKVEKVRIADAVYDTVVTYEGPEEEPILLTSKARYQHPYTSSNPNLCAHMRTGPLMPLTGIVKVAAKLSLPQDRHLEREASNYQEFPEHFYQHWSGLCGTPPLHDPFPMGALVPQFYGYYIPEKVEAQEYLSPILLLEDCGEQVNPEDLDEDEKNECFSLVLRFHLAGWLHNSIATRNFLVQRGSLFDWPLIRKQEDKRFRLIDFGRSVKEWKGLSRAGEEQECMNVFKIGTF